MQVKKKKKKKEREEIMKEKKNFLDHIQEKHWEDRGFVLHSTQKEWVFSTSRHILQ